jgi:hypothetical protein
MLDNPITMRKHMSFTRFCIVSIFLACAWLWPFCAVAQKIPAASPAVAYFPILPYGSTTDTLPQLLPIVANHSLEDDHSVIKRAIIVIHDRTRDANTVFNLMTNLAGEANQNTFIIAPQFLLESDMVRLGGQLPDHGHMFARWSLKDDGGAWEDGGDSAADLSQKGISSFTAMDLLLLFFADQQTFPNLEQVIIVGNGAGADFVTRYAAMGQGLGFLDRRHIVTHFIAANPSSFLYITASRPRDHLKGFVSVDPAQCPAYNNYKYGLDNLNPYGRRIGVAAIKQSFVTRHITYLLGETAAANDPMPDTSCAGQLEGSDRLMRAANYNLYLSVAFGPEASATQKFYTVPEAGYDPAQIFSSKCALISLFGDGNCSQ